ncbi:tail fiber domain-containing protein [Runella sp.]|uniref:tail fiber domain-containing protein n=1 Tax=Runella sp. TaxID=1960881 RepID=UPI003D0A0450
MKKFLFLCLLIANVSYGQIYVQSTTSSSITITPQGVTDRISNFTDTTNISFGALALKKNKGRYNTAFGSVALFNNEAGHFNTAIGYSALYYNTIGIDNTANGYRALNNNTEGAGNTAIGKESLHYNLTGFHNVGVGAQTLYYNWLGSENVAIGSGALGDNTTADQNTAVGTGSLPRNTTGRDNAANGWHTLFSNTTGRNNTAMGHSSGSTITTGSCNTFLGSYANASSNNFTNSTAIGYYAVVDASNKVRIGNSVVTVIEGAVPFSTPSDRRLKHNFAPSVLGLAFITRLAPMSYTYIADKTNVRRDGLIAQDVEKVMQELGVEFSGLQKSPDGTYSLAYSDFVMPLVNAVKEQQKELEELRKEINDLRMLKQQVEALTKMAANKQ